MALVAGRVIQRLNCQNLPNASLDFVAVCLELEDRHQWQCLPRWLQQILVENRTIEIEYEVFVD